MSVRVRLATYSDIPTLVELTREHIEASNYAGMRFDPDIMRDTFVRFIDEENRTCLLVEDQDNRTIGYTGGWVGQAMFGPDITANEEIFLVRQDERGQLVPAKRLVHAFCRWAAGWGAKRITFGNSAGIVRDEAYVRFFERYGFRRAGSIMFLEVNHGW